MAKHDVTALAAEFQSALSQQDWPLALVKADRLAAALPKNPSILYNRALVLKKLDRLQKACLALEEVLELEPRHDKARFELAACRLELAEFQSAITLFKTYLNHQPDDADARLNLGNALIHTGCAELAMDHLQQAYALSPDDQKASALAIACRDIGDLDGCEGWLDKLGNTPSSAALRLKIRTQGARGRIAIKADQPDRER